MTWPDRPVIFYDSACGFCNRSVQWLLKRGGNQVFYFAPLQGRTFHELVDPQTASQLPDSLIFWYKGKVLSQSRAIAAIASRLPWPWKSGALLALVPSCMGNFLYAQIAQRRHHLWRGGTYCIQPTKESADVFLP